MANNEGKVAPHVTNEVRLVLSGSKPLATIERCKDLTGFCMAVQMMGVGAVVGEVRPTTDSPAGEVVFVLPKNRQLLTEYADLIENGVALYGIKEYHRAMGVLFGYSLKDIDAFLDAEIVCDCVKCNGSSV